MKKIELQVKDAYDLSLVVSVVVREKSDKLDFQEILKLQKLSNEINSAIPEFVKEVDAFAEEKDVFVKNANAKISKFKENMQKGSENEGKLPEDYKEKLDAFVAMTMENAQKEIDDSVNPKYEEINKTLGEKVVILEVDDDKYETLVVNFELYAKEKYNNKSKMVETYEKIVSANSK